MEPQFDWLMNFGQTTPADAIAECHERGISFAEWAQEYVDQWPFDDQPEPDFVARVVRYLEWEQEAN